MSNVKEITSLFSETLDELSSGSWPDFLKTAAWSYKYSFADQLLIYAQKPDATACASIEFWNKKLRRVVRPGARHIALLDDSCDNLALKYVIDASDTEGDLPIPQWRMTEENKSAVFETLKKELLDEPVHAKPEETLFYDLIANNLIYELQSEQPEFFRASGLDEYDPVLGDFLICSIASIIMYRLGLKPEFEENPFDIDTIKSFGNAATITAAGYITQTLSQKALSIANRAVLQWEKTHKEEIEYEPELPESRGLSDSRIEDKPAGAESESLQPSEEKLSEGEPAGPLYADDNYGRASEPSDNDRPEDRGNDRNEDNRATESPAGTGQGESEPRLDAAHEQAQDDSRGRDTSDDGLRINETESLPEASEAGLEVSFPSYEEQLSVIELTSNPVQFSQNEIDLILIGLLNWRERESLKEIFSQNEGYEQTVKKIEDLYFDKETDITFLDGTSCFVQLEKYGYGLVFSRGSAPSSVSWEDICSRLKTLYQEGRFESFERIKDNPKNASEITSGQHIHLYGHEFLAVSSDEKSITLQDIEYPILTTAVEKDVLNILLASEKYSEIIEEPEAPSEEKADFKADEEPEAFSSVKKTLGMRNWEFFEEYAPEIMDGRLSYMRFESDIYQPLYIEKVAKDKIAIAHTFVQNGDLMLDPEIVFHISEDTKELLPFTYTQSSFAFYQCVYSGYTYEPSEKDRTAENDINMFFRTWSKNLKWQDHRPVRGVKYSARGDLEYTFDKERNMQRVLTPLENFVDRLILSGSGFAEGKYRIYNQLSKEEGRSVNAEFLKDEYGIGGGTVDLAEGVSQIHDPKGLKIYRGDEEILLKWTEVVDKIKGFINEERYLSENEMAIYKEKFLDAPSKNSVHNPEPLYDHPELYRRDLSRNERADKVVLTDLLIHFETYKASYALKRPPIGEYDHEAYEDQADFLENITVSESPEENRDSIKTAIAFCNRWFVPFSDYVSDKISEETENVLASADNLLSDWENLIFKPSEKEGSVHRFNEDYLYDILHNENMTHHTYNEVMTFFNEHESLEKRTEFLKEHFGDAYTSIYASFGNEKYLGFKAHDGRLEVWEDNYLSAEIKDEYSWEEICSIYAEEARIFASEKASAEVEKEADMPEDDQEELTLFDFVNDELAPVPVRSESATGDIRRNFKITEMEPSYGGSKERFTANIAAIKLLKELEDEERLATEAEQQVLSKYVGWGGLSEAFDERNKSWEKEYTQLKELLTEDEYESARESTLTAFYTPPVITAAIFNILKKMGFEKGNVLDPACGTGNFFGMLPEAMKDSKLYGVELDSISGRISRQLYQDANILIEGYEDASLPDSFFDVAISNVPFGDFKLFDKRYNKENFLIHDYFFAKTLDKVRPGGVIAFITSKGTMDKKNSSVREYIAKRADLLGAIRLPSSTFKDGAGTEAVADIIFLKKRERPAVEMPYWTDLDFKYDPELSVNAEYGDHGAEINAYFVDNPEMILGDMKEVSGPYGPEITYMPKEGQSLKDLLERAAENIEGEIILDFDEAIDEEIKDRSVLPADPDVKNFSFTLVDGDIYFREDSQMYKSDASGMKEARIKRLIELRDITRSLIDAQLEGSSDEAITSLQRLLNEKYDSFSEKYGLINSRANANVFSDDSSYYLLCSLEHVNDKGEFLGKADMFYKRTIGVHTVPTHADTALEALAICMSERAKVDLRYIGQLTGLSEDEALSELKGHIFAVPGFSGRYELSSNYLSGNVREKLKTASEAAQNNPEYLVNVEYLEKALPEDLKSEEISVRLGATWIPASDVTDFIHELLDPPSWTRERLKAFYEPATDTWTILNSSWGYNAKVYSTYGTSRADAYRLIQDALNQKNTQLYDTVTIDGKDRRVLNTEDTMAAREKQELIKEKFKDWLWQDLDRAERLTKLYNEKFNSIVPPEYEGNLVMFHNMNPLIELDKHQKDAVARILYGGNTQLAHVVGAGKTWTMVAAAMEGKHLGLCNKSLIVVPNHLVGQWASAIYELYPSANILASSKKDFETKNRKKFCSKIATGDYDIVVIGHSQFERIPLSKERQEKTLREQISDIQTSLDELQYTQEGYSFSVKQMESMKKRLKEKLAKLQEGKKRDDVITFEELGVDRLFIDESHEYKNLFLYTKMSNVAGISQTDSQKASDLFMKTRYMDEITGNMGNIHATGTPLSNTMAELYTSQRYLQYDLLNQMGLGSFDAWASTFGETVQSLELAPEGTGYRERTRFANFFNIPELINIYKMVADIRTADMLNLPVPEVEYHTDVVKPSEEQKAGVAKLAERADKIRGGGMDSSQDNMLCITNDGRKLALDQRLIDSSLPDNPESKANACADNIFKYYTDGADDKLTQLVFCDISTPKAGEFSVYEDLKEKLVERGIPSDEIRFIHEAKNDVQKEALFEKVRNGEVRVLMGSTGKMGTGTNVQDRLIAGHDLDVPWRPSDLEQRAGRIVRRGNNNEKVHMHRYVTEGTFDAYSYQLIEAKQRFASQIMTSKTPPRIANDVDESVLNYAQIKALASQDPRIKEKIELEMEVSRLQMLKRRHQADQSSLGWALKTLPDKEKELKKKLSGLEADAALIKSSASRTEKGELLPVTILGKSYEKQEEAGSRILAILKKLPEEGKWYTIGNLRGFDLIALKDSFGSRLAINGKRSYQVSYGTSGAGLMMRLNNVLDKEVFSDIESCENNILEVQHEFKTAQEEYGKPFANEDKLKEKSARLKVLEAELNLDAQLTMETAKNAAESKEGIKASSLSEMINNAAAKAEAQISQSNSQSYEHVH